MRQREDRRAGQPRRHQPEHREQHAARTHAVEREVGEAEPAGEVRREALFEVLEIIPVLVPAPVNISMTTCQIQTGWSPRSERGTFTFYFLRQERLPI